MSYNIRFDCKEKLLVKCKSNESYLSSRMSGIERIILSHNPDIISFQEIESSNIDKRFLELLNNYESYNYSSESNIVPNLIVWRKDLFSILANGNEKIDGKIKTIDGIKEYPRTIAWVKLENKSSKKVFFIFNTHFHPSQKKANPTDKLIRLNSANELIRLTEEITSGINCYIILTGDYNANPDEDCMKKIETIFNMPPFEENTLSPNFNEQGGGMYDYIMCSKNLKYKHYEIIKNKAHKGLKHPSDHLPVYANLI